MKRSESEKHFKAALNYFPGGVNSPVRAFRAIGQNPIFMAKGQSSKLIDVDGNVYVDYCNSWGPLIHGHAHPKVEQAIIETLRNGSTFGAPTLQENRLAALILKHHRFIEKIRFVSSGTEAVMSALRLARGYTKREKIIKFEGCYHGHFDGLLVKAGSGLATLGTSSSAGVPENYVTDTLVAPLNDLEVLDQIFKAYPNQIAAVIIEPIPANNGLLLQPETFLKALQEKCKQEGTLLIFDEVISGFRVGFEGAAGFYNIQPDIFTFGKIMGGGLPAGAYASSTEIMSKIAPEGEIYQAGTLSGNPLAMAAGLAQLEICLEENFYKDLNEKTKFLAESVTSYAKEKNYAFHIPYVPGLFWLNFSNQKIDQAEKITKNSIEKFNQFYIFLLENGIYLGPSGYEVGFLSSAHSFEDLEKTAQIFKQGLDIVYKF